LDQYIISDTILNSIQPSVLLTVNWHPPEVRYWLFVLIRAIVKKSVFFF
jgi:hypothetical protein